MSFWYDKLVESSSDKIEKLLRKPPVELIAYLPFLPAELFRHLDEDRNLVLTDYPIWNHLSFEQRVEHARLMMQASREKERRTREKRREDPFIPLDPVKIAQKKTTFETRWATAKSFSKGSPISSTVPKAGNGEEWAHTVCNLLRIETRQSNYLMGNRTFFKSDNATGWHLTGTTTTRMLDYGYNESLFIVDFRAVGPRHAWVERRGDRVFASSQAAFDAFFAKFPLTEVETGNG